MPKGLPLQAVLTAVLVALVLVASGGVGLTAAVATQRSLEASWEVQARSLGDTVTQEVAGFLRAAEPLTRSMPPMDPQAPEATLAWMDGALQANPNITWLAWAGAEGQYLATMRWPTDDGVELRRSIRGDGVHQDYRHTPDGLEALARKDSDYDPRERPFWGANGWLGPYVFLSRQQPGVSFARSADDHTWIVDYECSALSDFVASLETPLSGRIYVVAADGRVMAHPDGLVTGPQGIYTAAEHPDTDLAAAWAAAGETTDGVIATDQHRISVRPLTRGPAGFALVVIPNQRLYAPVAQQAARSALVALAVVLCAMAMGLVLSRRLGGALDRMARALDRIAHFDLRPQDLPRPPVVELEELAEAHDTMKRGLTSFGRYVPRPLVRRVLETGREARIGANSREVTILFCSIEGFDELVEREPQLYRRLSEYLDRVDRCIQAEAGTVSQFLGDVTMAIWGAPTAQDDHRDRAVRAALAIQQAIADLELPSTIGINTGVCLVGNIGARDRFAYNALGDPVNTAARINGLNKVYGTRVLVGEATVSGLTATVRPVDWVRMKGKARTVMVHEPLTPDLAQAAQTYADALDAYRQRRFEEAVDAFERTPWAQPLADRARTYIQHPPPPDWDGSFTMRTK